MQRMQRMKQTYTEQRAAEKSAGRVASPGGFAGSARKRNSSMSRIRQTSERELAPSAEAVRGHHANSDTAATCQTSRAVEGSTDAERAPSEIADVQPPPQDSDSLPTPKQELNVVLPEQDAYSGVPFVNDYQPLSPTTALDKKRNAFKTLDKNGDNSISPEELQELMEDTMGLQMTRDQVWNVIKDFDLDGNNDIDFNEFISFLDNFAHNEGAYGDDSLKNIFNLLDAKFGQKGSLDAVAVQHLLKKLQSEVTLEEAEAMIGIADPYNNGRLFREQFLTMVQNTAYTDAMKGARVYPKGGQHTGEDLWSMLTQQVLLLSALCELWNYGQVMCHGEEKTAKKKRRRCIAHPDDNRRQAWDLCMIPLLLYISAVVPFRIGFDIPNTTFGTLWWVDVGIDIAFVADMVLNFRTAYYDTDDQIVFSPCRIAIEYLKTWFLVDFFACFPFGYIALWTEGATVASSERGGGTSRILKIVRLLRLAKMFAKMARLARLKRAFQQWNERLPPIFQGKIVSLLFMLLTMSHWMACVWFFVGSTEQFLVADDNSTRVPGWVEREQWPEGTHLSSKYTTAFFVCVTNFSPEIALFGTDLEKVYSSAITIIYEALIGYMVGTFASMTLEGRAGHGKYRQKIQDLQEFALNHHVNVKIRKKIRTYLDHVYLHKTAFDEQSLLDELPEMIWTSLL